MNKLMFTFWNISPKLAFALSAIFPAILLSEAVINGELVHSPLITLAVAAGLFYVVNFLLRVLDDFI